MFILNVDDLNAPKGCWLMDWIKKQEPMICSLQETHWSSKDTSGC